MTMSLLYIENDKNKMRGVHSLAKRDPVIIYIITAPNEYEGVGGWGTLGPFVTRGLSCRVVHNCTKTTRAGAYAQLD